jgi:hypothetical protein
MQTVQHTLSRFRVHLSAHNSKPDSSKMQGLNKVLVLVNGPAEPPKRSADSSDEMVCRIDRLDFTM